MCDDVFDEENALTVPEENEWTKMEESRTVDGFRDGIAKGEEEQLQAGFNSGYIALMRPAFNLAKLRGKISAILGRNLTNEGLVSPETDAKLKDLLGKVLTLEAALIKHQKQDPKEDSETCDKGTSCCGGGNDNCAKGGFNTTSPTEYDNSDSLKTFVEKIHSLNLDFRLILEGSKIERVLQSFVY